MKISFVLPLTSSVILSSAWTQSTNTGASRRTFLDSAAKLVPLVAVASPAFADDEPATPAPDAAPVEEAKKVEANEFIARLKTQSEANKEAYKKKARLGDKLSTAQFSSQYDRPSYVGVRKDDGSFTMVLKEELKELLASGKAELTYETKINKKTGEVRDDVSKKVYTFK
jgi:hypothetical protein